MDSKDSVLEMTDQNRGFYEEFTSGLDGIFSPTLSAALWIGLSSPARLREVMVNFAVWGYLMKQVRICSFWTIFLSIWGRFEGRSAMRWLYNFLGAQVRTWHRIYVPGQSRSPGPERMVIESEGNRGRRVIDAIKDNVGELRLPGSQKSPLCNFDHGRHSGPKS